VIGIVGLIGVVLMAFRERAQAAADALVTHTLEVVGQVEATKSDLRGASNELRGYVLTHQEQWLEASRRHLRLGQQAASLTAELVRDNPVEQARAATMLAIIRDYTQWSQELLEIFNAQGLAGAAAAVRTGNGESALGSLDRTANAVLTEERGLLSGRQHTSSRLRKAALGLQIMLALLVTAQVFASGYLVRARYKSDQREQETLRLSQAYAESIVATIRHPLIVLDSFLRVVSANRAYYQQFQVAAGPIEGLPLTEIAGGMWNIPELVAHLHSVIDEHEPMESFRLLHRFAALGNRQLLLNARKVYQPGVRTGLLLVAIEDETERAKSEERLEQINRELQGFAYSVAHDLRAPLRGMQGFSEALREDYGQVLDETGRSYTLRIAAAAKRMDELIRDLLDYSRLARAELPIAPVEIYQVVAAAKQQLAGVLQEAGATLNVPEDLPVVQGHFGTLVQVLANLLGNSAKFVPLGIKPVVTIQSETRGNVVRISVADNGIGVAPQFHEKIFQVFERLHGPEEFPGTGIGLAVVRKGIERLGGRVGVESAAGSGACFWFELPAAPGPMR
jgi:signal transduction histidine kinase/CHASE3 domain sensor protein